MAAPGKLSKTQRCFLADLFPGEQSLFNREEKLIFGTDASRKFCAAWAVVRPEKREQVVELLVWADRERVPLIPRARATNVVGDCVPVHGGVVVSTLKLDRILDIDKRDFVAVVEPGVVSGDLQKAVETRKLFYPPDPASVKMSTIGGNVSTNAGGMRAVKYGVTGDYVLGLEVVLPGGDVIHTGGRVHKNAVGLDLTRLLVGSEGTLGFVTEVILKLLPLPEATASLLTGFSSLDDCMEAAARVFDAGILPVAMELMDKAVLDILPEVTEVPWTPGTNAALLFKLDGSREALPGELARLEKVVSGADPNFMARGLGPESEEELWEIRRLINPASFRVKPDKMSQDVTLPRGKVGKAIEQIHGVGRECGLPVLTFGHLGDGNVHVNVMFDKTNARETEAALKATDRILGLVLELEGTLSGEHGVGLAKLPYLDRQLGRQERSLMGRIKHAFDPNNIMNPGKAY